MKAYDMKREAVYTSKKIQSTLYIMIRPPIHRLEIERLLRVHQLFTPHAPIYDDASFASIVVLEGRCRLLLWGPSHWLP